MRTLMKVGLLSVLLFFTSALLAITPPDELISNISSQVLQELRDANANNLKNKNPNYVTEIVNHLLVPHADFAEMSRRVLGLAWRKASASQRERFEKEFSTLVVRTYGTALEDFRDQKIAFPKRPLRYNSKGNLAEVRTVIREAGKADTPVNYRLVKRASGWKVYDIIIEGVSIVNSYRTQFQASIRRDGLDKVIVDIAAKNRQSVK